MRERQRDIERETHINSCLSVCVYVYIRVYIYIRKRSGERPQTRSAHDNNGGSRPKLLQLKQPRNRKERFAAEDNGGTEMINLLLK